MNIKEERKKPFCFQIIWTLNVALQCNDRVKNSECQDFTWAQLETYRICIAVKYTNAGLRDRENHRHSFLRTGEVRPKRRLRGSKLCFRTFADCAWGESLWEYPALLE